MPKISKTELVELFFHEVDSYIPGIRKGLELLSSDRSAIASIQELHRLFHNIKGAASQVQLGNLSKGAKVVEDTLSPIVEEEGALSDGLLRAISKTTDLLLAYRDKHISSPEEELSFYEPVTAFFSTAQKEDAVAVESGGLASYMEDIRSIFTLLQELVGYFSEDGRDPEHDKTIYGKLSHAVSILSLTVQGAGMKQQGQLSHDFHLLLDKLNSGAIPHQPELTGLMTDFFQFLDVAYSCEDPENSLVVRKVEEQLHRLQALLDMPLPSEDPGSAEEDIFSLDGADIFEDDGEDAESIDFLAELDEADFVDEDPDDDPLGGQALEEISEEVEFELQPELELEGEALEEASGEEEGLSEDQQLLMEIFGQECEEHLTTLNQSLGVLQEKVEEECSLTPELKDPVGEMRRAAHTLKGAAAMTGLDLISRVSRSLENMLDWLLDEFGRIAPREIQVVENGVEVIQSLSKSLQLTEYQPAEQLIETVEEYLASSPSSLAEEIAEEEGVFADEIEADLTEEDSTVEDIFEDSLNDEILMPEADLPGPPEEVEPEEERLSEDQQLLMEIFREECDEHLIVINQSLNFLENKVGDHTEFSPELKEAVSEMRRAVHTLKGAASMTGVNLLAKGAHSLEDMLDWLHDESEEIQSQDVQLIGSGIDVIELLSQSPQAKESNRLNQLVASIDAYLLVRTDDAAVAGVEQPDGHTGTGQGIAEEFAGQETDAMEPLLPELPSDLGTLRVKLDDLDELVSIEGELVVARGAMEKMLDEFSSTLVELENVKENLKRKSQELEAGFEVQSLYGFNPVSGGAGGGAKGGKAVQAVAGGFEEPGESDLSDFDPIELDRYSQLNLIIRSLNEISVDVNSIHSTLTSLTGDIGGQVGKQQLTMRLMQEKLMRIRMTPLSSISRVLFRTVRDTSRKLEKKVALTITGEDVYMDRFVWARITDPLMHILRNGVDHGIETAEIRDAAGKPESGTINLQAEQRSRYVVLRVSDDGGGIDLDRVREKIKRDRLAVSPEGLSEREVLEFLFHPSFSTRSDITTISGRGVGLDVVRRNIQDLRGTVQLHNEQGKGVVFEIQIPFTLSVNRAVLVSVGGRDFAVPLQDIQQVKHFYPEEIEEDNGLSVTIDEQNVPLVNLGYYMQMEKRMDRVEPDGDGNTGATAILFTKGDKQYAVAIDSVEEQREIVVKDLGSHLTYVPGISGVTLTGTGGLIPILNMHELVEVQVEEEGIEGEAKLPLEQYEPLKVLIVDDSISVRHSVARLVESQSWQQQQAVDGLDALAKLENFMPDVIILDIEMPRMNGYEFKSSLNNQQQYKDIPVVMLTSRVSEKHQQKARDLGVQHYLTKPYQDEVFVELLEKIKR